MIDCDDRKRNSPVIKRIFRGYMSCLALALAATPAIAAPPPPPPPGALERDSKIINVPKSEGLPEYLKLFLDDVKVVKDDKVVATGTTELEKYLKSEIGLNRRILNVSHGRPIIVAETVNNMAYRGPGIVQDCCFWARVTLYFLNDAGKVKEVRIIENGTYWGSPGEAI